MTPCLPLFPGFGVLKRRNANYDPIHACLVATYQKSKSALHTKRQRAEIRSRRFKQTAELHR